MCRDDNLEGWLSWWLREGLQEEVTSEAVHNVKDKEQLATWKLEKALEREGGPWKSVPNSGNRVCAGQEVRESMAYSWNWEKFSLTEM